MIPGVESSKSKKAINLLNIKKETIFPYSNFKNITNTSIVQEKKIKEPELKLENSKIS